MGPYTLRALVRMVELRQRIEWDHTAMIVATILNSRQGLARKDLIKDPSRLNPYRKKVKRKSAKIQLTDFAKAFGK